MIKYRTAVGCSEITEIEVERETDASVFIRGCGFRKHGSFHNYHDSWDEAKAYLLADAEQKVANARRKLELANSYHGNIEGLRRR